MIYGIKDLPTLHILLKYDCHTNGLFIWNTKRDLAHCVIASIVEIIDARSLI
jgi:hypothetical protein